jgi:iron complex outermembrane receptor protein
LAADRTALVTSCASTLVNTTGNAAATGNCGKTSGFTGKPSYVHIGAYALLNFQAEYAFNDMTTMTVGGMNLLDENFSLAEGFPEPGRQFFANLRARF